MEAAAQQADDLQDRLNPCELSWSFSGKGCSDVGAVEQNREPDQSPEQLFQQSAEQHLVTDELEVPGE